MMTDASTIMTLGREPITEDNPVGEPVRVERLDWFKTEIGKSESIRDEQANWNAVMIVAVQVLQHQSKDFRVAGYLCCALAYMHQHSGLNVGLAVIQDLLTHYWDNAHPPLTRLRRRVAMLEWLGTKAIFPLIRAELPTREQADAILRQMDYITRYYNQKTGSQIDHFQPLQKYYTTAIEQLNNPPSEREPEAVLHAVAEVVDEITDTPSVEKTSLAPNPAPEKMVLTPEKLQALRSGLDQYAEFFDQTMPQLIKGVDTQKEKP